MKLVIEVLSRSLRNLEAEEMNILKSLNELQEDILEQQKDLNLLRSKMSELNQAISILGEKNVTITSKDKKIKSKGDNS